MRNRFAILLLIFSYSASDATSESQSSPYSGTTGHGTYTNEFFKLTWHFPVAWQFAPVADLAASKTGFHQLLRLFPSKNEEVSFAIQDFPPNRGAWETFPETMRKTVTNDGWEAVGESTPFFLGNFWLRKQEFARKDNSHWMSTILGPLRGHELEFFVSAASHEELEQLLEVILHIQVSPDWQNQSLLVANGNDPEAAPELFLEDKDFVKKLHILRGAMPEYPAIAGTARVQGIVVLECRITRHGKVESIYVLEGNPMLVQSAIDAVSQWEYEPFKRRDIPVPVQTEISVVFSLHPK